MGRSTLVATAVALTLLAGCSASADGSSAVQPTGAPAPADDSGLQLRPVLEVALVVDGVLWSAPTVATRIEGGLIEIHGLPDLAQAQAIADTLTP